MIPVSLLMPTRSLRSIHPDCFAALTSNKCLRQVVVVVDGTISDEETAEASRLRTAFPGWEWDILFTGKSKGNQRWTMDEALNLGIDVLRYPLCARQDDDDISHPQRLDIQQAYFEKDPRLVVLGSQLAYVRNGCVRVRRYPTAHRDIIRHLAWTTPFAHPTIMIRTDVLRELQYRPVLYCEDYDLFIRTVGYGLLRNLDEPLVTYTIKDDTALRRFRHGPVFRAHAAVQWEHRAIIARGILPRWRSLGLIGAELAFSIMPRWCYRLYYRWCLYP